jgi:hypothetical protein
MCIMALEPISTACFVNPYQSLCLYVYPSIVARQHLGKNLRIVARQRLDKNFTAARNIHVAIELSDASFSVLSLSYQGK